ncbi:MAG TPA: universal stress protein [Vicinamibacterales bacterium]|nr:universal stress protein [Vicinamibacterales bacterium]
MTGPTVICPIDFSEHSRMALRLARAVTDRFAGRLVILHVNDPLLAAAASTHEMDLQKEAEEELQAILAGEPRGIPSPPPTMVVRKGDAAEEILGLAAREGADLIVMGTHGLTGYRKLFFGSTTERVLRQTRVPVVAVPLRPELAIPGGGSSLNGWGPVIAPVDFSDASARSAHVAAGIGATLKAPVVLVHVTRPVVAHDRWRDRAEAATDASTAEGVHALEALAASLRARLRVETTVLGGEPAEEIARLAIRRKASLIVMGLRGAGGLFAPAVGSTAYRVLTLAPVPVLAIPTEFEVPANWPG